jgi:hypothetical protein
MFCFLTTLPAALSIARSQEEGTGRLLRKAVVFQSGVALLFVTLQQTSTSSEVKCLRKAGIADLSNGRIFGSESHSGPPAAYRLLVWRWLTRYCMEAAKSCRA